MSNMQIITIQVKGHGDVLVTRALDEAGNARMLPVAGAATLSQWREDKSLLPPWLLPDDLEDGQDWIEIMCFLHASDLGNIPSKF